MPSLSLLLQLSVPRLLSLLSFSLAGVHVGWHARAETYAVEALDEAEVALAVELVASAGEQGGDAVAVRENSVVQHRQKRDRVALFCTGEQRQGEAGCEPGQSAG